jgi:hypothetical protein
VCVCVCVCVSGLTVDCSLKWRWYYEQSSRSILMRVTTIQCGSVLRYGPHTTTINGVYVDGCPLGRGEVCTCRVTSKSSPMYQAYSLTSRVFLPWRRISDRLAKRATTKPMMRTTYKMYLHAALHLFFPFSLSTFKQWAFNKHSTSARERLFSVRSSTTFQRVFNESSPHI